jgi:hypothetical protein
MILIMMVMVMVLAFDLRWDSVVTPGPSFSRSEWNLCKGGVR